MKWILRLLKRFIHQKKIEASIFASPPYSRCPIRDLNYDQILSNNEESVSKIREHAKGFNFDDYQIHKVPNLGLFFLEASAKKDWIKDVLRQGSAWESYVAQYIQKYAKPGTLVLDVGAHIGTHTLNLARAVGQYGKVIAFEPRPKTFTELLMNAQVNGAKNIYCFWGAVGDKNEVIPISKCHPEVEVQCLFDFTFGDSGDTAPIVTLDSLDLNNISFMKVDVDGYDDMFLDGAKETVLRNKPVILMEILGGADPNNAEHQRMIRQTKQKIMDLGYRVEKVAEHDYLAMHETTDNR